MNTKTIFSQITVAFLKKLKRVNQKYTNSTPNKKLYKTQLFGDENGGEWTPFYFRLPRTSRYLHRFRVQ